MSVICRRCKTVNLSATRVCANCGDKLPLDSGYKNVLYILAAIVVAIISVVLYMESQGSPANLKRLVGSSGGWGSAKPQSQRDFEKEYLGLVQVHTNSPLGTRASESASQNLSRFESASKGMRVKGWRCKYSDIGWVASDHKLDLGHGDNYTLNCTDVDAAIGDEFARSRFSLLIPIKNLKSPPKLYRGDLITFDGTINFVQSTGFVPNKNNYEVDFYNVSNVNFVLDK